MTERERERQAAIYEGEFATQEEKIKVLEKEIRQAERDYCYHKGYAEGKRDAMKWISVEERLPEDFDTKVVWTDRGILYLATFTGMRWYTSGCETIRDEEVTHWMPLPPPPEGGQDD